MTTFPSVTGKDLISALANAGFVVARVKGAIIFFGMLKGEPPLSPPILAKQLVRALCPKSFAIAN